MSAAVCKKVAEAAPRLARTLRTSAARASGGHDEPAYLHAEHMYDIKSMKHRKLKFGLACSGIVASGVVLPWMCVHWQLKKAGG